MKRMIGCLIDKSLETVIEQIIAKTGITNLSQIIRQALITYEKILSENTITIVKVGTKQQ